MIVGHRVRTSDIGEQRRYRDRREVIDVDARDKVQAFAREPELARGHRDVNAATRAVDRCRTKDQRWIWGGLDRLFSLVSDPLSNRPGTRGRTLVHVSHRAVDAGGGEVDEAAWPASKSRKQLRGVVD